MRNRSEQLENREDREEKEAETAPTLVGGAVSMKNSSLRVKIKLPKTGKNHGQDHTKNKSIAAEHVQGEKEGSQAHLNANDCCLCPKKFRSDKALYGHMRLHTGRNWKGVRPPPDAEGAENRTSSLLRSAETRRQDRSDLTEIADSTWSQRVTARRTLKTRSPPSRSKISQDSEKDAVRNLMMLANGGDAAESPLKKRKEAEERFRAENRASTSKKQKTAGDSAASSGKQSNIEQEEEEEEEEEEIDENKSLRNSDKKRKEKTVSDLLDKKPSVVSNSRFACSICDKSYATHQALGGHIAGHKKDRIERDQQGAAAADPSQKPKPKPATDKHQCKHCDKAWPTGQALGGHQRCHWGGGGGPVDDSSGSSGTTVTSQVDNERAGRRVLDLDLNELPPPE